MRKVILWMLLGLLYGASVALAQDCDKTVVDYNGALKGREAQVEQASNALIQQGADVRVRVVGQTDNLDMDEKQYEKSCASWRSPSGRMKSTMVVLMASPVSHKMGLYYGDAWKSALDSNWVRIKQEMGPRFRDGDFAGGFIIAEQHLTARLVAAKDEAMHPNQTVNQATDLSGLWLVLEWMVGIITLGLAVWFGLWLVFKKKREQAEVSQEQQSAQLYRTRCSAIVNSARDNKEAWVNSWLERYNELSQSEKLNPDTPGLSREEYAVIKEQWKDFYEALITHKDGGIDTSDIPEVKDWSKAERGKFHRPSGVAESSAASSSILSGNTIIAPVIVNEEEEQPHQHRKDDDNDGSWHGGGGTGSSWSGSSSSDGDAGGGSSSWESSDTSSDSGGSSDFGGGDSGGSDSGSSGGSSDF